LPHIAHRVSTIGYRFAMELSLVDRWLCGAEMALRTLSGGSRAERATPLPSASPLAGDPPTDTAAPAQAAPELSADEKRLSGALMRVNHVGEVCAQALYQAQKLATRSASLRAVFDRAAVEEEDHLAWTAKRLEALDSRPSLLNPLWYVGALTVGLAAGRLGDRVSLGFMAETERQVEHHLDSHMDRLPAADRESRAIVEQMRIDEAAHGKSAMDAGGIELPFPARALMRAMSKVMTRTAYYI
jgi:ubiquinone biosynthesis monooxygenase Coq7